MSAPLMTCPFCGESNAEAWAWLQDRSAGVTCDCGARIEVPYGVSEERPDMSIGKRDAVAAWNRRTSSTEVITQPAKEPTHPPAEAGRGGGGAAAAAAPALPAANPALCNHSWSAVTWRCIHCGTASPDFPGGGDSLDRELGRDASLDPWADEVHPRGGEPGLSADAMRDSFEGRR